MNLLQCQKATTALLISELPNQTCIILVAQYSTLQDLMPGMLYIIEWHPCNDTCNLLR